MAVYISFLSACNPLRILSRNHGADLCRSYTPMFHARLFAESAKYRNENFTTNEQDRPLIVQFCANDPEYLLQAALLVQDQCDAVDLNLGCPQHIAKRGHYGSYLMEDWPLIESLVKKLSQNLTVPVTCKIRIYTDLAKSIAYAKMLVNAGCTLLTVHGRTRDQKGHNTGLADWEYIREIKKAVDVPVFANGNILYFEDVATCIKSTGAEGVMTAEGNLYNPGLFEQKLVTIWDMATEYLDICENVKDSADSSQIKSHLFKLFKCCLSKYTTQRTTLATARSIQEFREITNQLKELMWEEFQKCEYMIGDLETGEDGVYCGVIPMWYCQAYIRPPLVVNARKLKAEAENVLEVKGESVIDVDCLKESKKIKLDEDTKAEIDAEK